MTYTFFQETSSGDLVLKMASVLSRTMTMVRLNRPLVSVVRYLAAASLTSQVVRGLVSAW